MKEFVQYQFAKEELLNEFSKKSFKDLLLNDGQFNRFSTFSITLDKFMPEIKIENHKTIFRNILQNQSLAALDLKYPELIETPLFYSNVSKENFNALSYIPHVITTFHLGSFRLTSLLLAQSNIQFSLVIASENLSAEGKNYIETVKRLTGQDLTLIDAEKPSALLTMCKEVRKGKSLVIYVDGNRGTKTKSRENFCDIRFFDGRLSVRKGAAFLSHFLNIPIMMGLNFWDQNSNVVFHFSTSIYPNKDILREEYTIATMQCVYTEFEFFLKQYPEQWECWIYLYKSMLLDTNKPNAIPNNNVYSTIGIDPHNRPLTFNLDKYCIFTNHSETFVMDRQTLLSQKINSAEGELLMDAVFETITIDEHNSTIISSLIQNNFIA